MRGMKSVSFTATCQISILGRKRWEIGLQVPKPWVGTMLENRGLRFESETNAKISVNRIHWRPGTQQSLPLHAEECSEGGVNLQ